MKKLVLPIIVLSLFVSGLGNDLSIVVGGAPTSDLEINKETFTDIELKSFTVFGVRFEKGLVSILGWENNFLFSTNVMTPKGLSGENGLSMTTNLVLNIPASETVVPNFAVGFGFLHRFGESFPNIGSSFVTSWGGGLKFREVIGPAGFRFDYRRMRIYSVEDSSVIANELTGGIMFSF
ncbi:MAG: hypothetical protein JSU96_17925 [Acidobacteriota bacterium]|nr:MAG: hypothetical protein JSU96_17925 [Acidobacteriota bacterium]